MKKRILSIILITVMTLSLLSATEKPHKMISFLKSAILPGWGELSQNHKSAYLFFSTEASLILSYKYYDIQSDNKTNESLLFAYKKAHVPFPLKDDELRLMIGKFRSSGYNAGGYNESIVKDAVSLYPDDLTAQTNYIKANALPDEVYWSWDTTNDQTKYRLMRKDSDELKDMAKVLSGAIIVNHIISAFNAARVTRNTPDIKVGFNGDMKPLLMYGCKF